MFQNKEINKWSSDEDGGGVPLWMFCWGGKKGGASAVLTLFRVEILSGGLKWKGNNKRSAGCSVRPGWQEGGVWSRCLTVTDFFRQDALKIQERNLAERRRREEKKSNAQYVEGVSIMSEKLLSLSLSLSLSRSLSLARSLSLSPSDRTVSAQEAARTRRLVSLCEVPVSGEGGTRWSADDGGGGGGGGAGALLDVLELDWWCWRGSDSVPLSPSQSWPSLSPNPLLSPSARRNNRFFFLLLPLLSSFFFFFLFFFDSWKKRGAGSHFPTLL